MAEKCVDTPRRCTCGPSAGCDLYCDRVVAAEHVTDERSDTRQGEALNEPCRVCVRYREALEPFVRAYERVSFQYVPDMLTLADFELARECLSVGGVEGGEGRFAANDNDTGSEKP